MNVLVTGGGGFLGSHLACRLQALGHCVSVLGRRRYSNLPEEITQVQADLRDATLRDTNLKGAYLGFANLSEHFSTELI